MADIDRGHRRGANRYRAPDLTYEQRTFIAVDDVIKSAAWLEVNDDITETNGHRLLKAAQEFRDLYDASRRAPVASFFHLTAALRGFEKTAADLTFVGVYSPDSMLASVRGHNLAIRQRLALDKPNRGEPVSIPDFLSAERTGTDWSTHVGLFSRAAAGRLFAEMVQHYFETRVGYEKDIKPTMR
jgi:hypothetical protein